MHDLVVSIGGSFITTGSTTTSRNVRHHAYHKLKADAAS